MDKALYPQSPALDHLDFIKPSNTFKKAATSVVIAIILFFLFYVFLLLTSGIILALCIWLGVTIISLKVNSVTLGAGLSLIALGVMFFAFLIKFIFARQKDENPLRMEIKEDEYPELFSFIRQVARETNTKFPKKVFVSPDVNACVFYNSSFWSMFFPVRKNLEIGLALVNTLNISEFKGVLAHEFGHFSQRSMKVGSYIYTVNRAIYNLVYENDKWDELMYKWVAGGGVFGFFAKITNWMADGVRYLLKVAYNLINIHYMKLSREMEYHADLVAVSLSGNEAFKSALRKIEFSAFAYESTTTNLNQLAANNKATHNLFHDHTSTINFLAKHNQLKTQAGNLIISDEDLEKSVVKSRIYIKDQWATHPSLKEREDNLSKVNITCTTSHDSAWKLFRNADKLQIKATKHLYQQGFHSQEFENLGAGEFLAYVEAETDKYKIADEYHGFYDNRYLTEFELKNLAKANPVNTTFQEIYASTNIELIKRHYANKSDLAILSQISLKQIDVRNFEFDGIKYKRKDAKTLIRQLSQEIEQDETKIKDLDKQSFQFFYQLAAQSYQQEELTNKYLNLFSRQKNFQEMHEISNKLGSFTNSLHSQQHWTEGEFSLMLTELTSVEKEFRNKLFTLDLELLTTHAEDQNIKELLTNYWHDNSFYSKSSEFDEQGFIHLNNLVFGVYSILGNTYGTCLKELTDFQLSLNISKPVKEQ